VNCGNFDASRFKSAFNFTPAILYNFIPAVDAELIIFAVAMEGVCANASGAYAERGQTAD
jgi:hypothetical protein